MSTQLFPKFLGASPNSPRNGFDLSQRHVYSTKAGILNCPFHLHTLSKGEYSIDVRQVLRTQPIQTAAFTRLDQSLDFYHVMINDLYSGFNQYVAQNEDKQLASTPAVDGLPRFNLKYFVTSLIMYCVYDYIVDHPYTNSAGHTLSVNQLSEVKYVIVPEVDIHQSVALGCLRMLDMFGYGNYLPVVLRIYTLVCESMLASYAASHVFATYSDFIVKYGDLSDISDEMDPQYYIPDVDLNLWVPLAYNKVFENHYRNPYYDLRFGYFSCYDGVVSPRYFEYVQLFNVDDVGNNELTNFDRLICIFAPKSHQYPKDMFTGVLPSTQYGDVSVLTDDRSWLNLVSDKRYADNQPLGVVGTSNPGINPVGQVYSGGPNLDTKFRFDPALAISVLNQRRADALQRFNENKMRAGNRTKSNFIAHGWNAPKSEQGHEAFYLGSFDGQISLNAVAATSPSGDVELGQLASNGVGVLQGDKIHVKSDDFGIVLGIFCISKPCEYDSFGVDYGNMLLDKWDFPYTELQNISLAPLDSLQLNVCRRALIDDGRFNGDLILGYLPRFISHKTAVDKIHGEFFSSDPAMLESGTSSTLRKGIFANYVTPRSENDFSDEKGFLYVRPDSVDNIFSLLSDGSQDTDQFLVNCQFDVFAVQPLSVIGLPTD